MNTNPFPEWSHNRHTRHTLRLFCESSARLVTAGLLDADTAGRFLDRAGVPFEDQCRIVREALAVREICPEPEEFTQLEAACDP